MPDRLVVLGGNAGAMGTATQAKRLRPDLEVVAFERGEHTSYSACGIPYFVGNEVDSLDRLVARSARRSIARGAPAPWRRRPSPTRRQRHRSRSSGRARPRFGGGARRRGALRSPRHWSRCARPTPDDPGHRPSVRARCRTLEDGAALLHEAEQVQCKKVVVVGGGYIGLEMAEAFTRWGASAVVLDGGDQVMRTLDADMAKLVAYAMERLGLPVHLGVRATGFDERQVITDHGEFEADIVVLGLGVQPNSEVAGEAGIERGGARRHRGRRSSAHERGWCVGRGRLL